MPRSATDKLQNQATNKLPRYLKPKEKPDPVVLVKSLRRRKHANGDIKKGFLMTKTEFPMVMHHHSRLRPTEGVARLPQSLRDLQNQRSFMLARVVTM
jgi:hypothetical protein